jgi:hypothetical protein
MPPQQVPTVVDASIAGGVVDAKESKQDGKSALVRNEWIVGIDFEDEERELAAAEDAEAVEDEEQEQDDELLLQRVAFVADNNADAAAADTDGAKLLLEESAAAREDVRLKAAAKTALRAPSREPEDDQEPAILNFNDVNSARLVRFVTVLNNERNMAKWNAHELTQDPTLALFKVSALASSRCPCLVGSFVGFLRLIMRCGSIGRQP